MSLLDDLVSGDGLSSIHGIIWIALGVWALIGTLFYIPAKRKQDKISEVLSYLEKNIEDRKKSKTKSYTSDLLSKGIDRISQKVGEEAIEVVIASNNKKKKQVIYESADLIFHLLVLWAKLNIKKNDIAKELLRRKK